MKHLIDKDALIEEIDRIKKEECPIDTYEGRIRLFYLERFRFFIDTLEVKDMDYEEKYKMALEGIQEILSSGQDSIKMSRLQLRLQGIFPELKTRKSENDTMIEVVKNIIAMTDKVSLDEILNIYGKSKDDIISWLEKQDKTDNNVDKIEPKFNVGDIISNGKIVYRVDGITKNSLGQNCYSLVDVESEKKGTRYLTLYDSKGEAYHMGETSWLCEQVDAKFEKQ